MVRQQLAEMPIQTLLEFAHVHELEVRDGIAKAELVELIAEELEETELEREWLDNHPIRIEQMKYDLLGAAVFSQSPRPGEEVSLPDSYNETRIVLMLRDPAWAFTYWDLHDGTLQEFIDDDEFEELLLCVVEVDAHTGVNHRTTVEPVASFDIPVQPSDSSWYIHLPQQGTYYRIDLHACCGGRRTLLAESNVVAVPPGNLAANGEDEAATRADQILALSGLQKLDVATYGERRTQRLISLIGD